MNQILTARCLHAIDATPARRRGGVGSSPRAPDSLFDCAQVEGAKEEGIVYLECLKNLNGRLHFTFVGVDVCDIAETRLIVHGSDERMTEKADHLQKLIDFKKDNSPPKE